MKLLETIRSERRASIFLATYAQSALGTGAGATALVVLAYERFGSPWAITAILLANFVPGMLLGPLFGAAADRWSRRRIVIVADLIRAAAFVTIGTTSGFAPTVALALVAGAASGLFSPAALAALPSLVKRDRLAALTSLYGGASDLGRTLGPLLAALAFPLIGVSGVLIANGVSFAISALVLALLPFGARSRRRTDAVPRTLLREAEEGLRLTARLKVVRVVLVASSATILFAAMLNVAELLLANELGAGSSGYGWLVTAFGVGIVCGSLSGSRGGELHELRRRYLAGLLLIAVALLFLASVRVYALALPAFFAAGLANGLVVVHERLLFQALVPAGFRGRAFGLLDTLGSWAFAAAFIAAGAIVAAVGVRGVMVVSGVGCLAVWAIAAQALRRDAGECYADASIVRGVDSEASTARTASL